MTSLFIHLFFIERGIRYNPPILRALYRPFSISLFRADSSILFPFPFFAISSARAIRAVLWNTAGKVAFARARLNSNFDQRGCLWQMRGITYSRREFHPISPGA